MKKILTLTLALLGGVASLSAQETAAPGKRDRQALKFGKTITPEDARKHLSVLASDEYEGRNTGEKGDTWLLNTLPDTFGNWGSRVRWMAVTTNRWIW